MKRSLFITASAAVVLGTIAYANSNSVKRAAPADLYFKVGSACILGAQGNIQTIFEDNVTLARQARIESSNNTLYSVYGNNNCDAAGGTILRVAFN